MKLQQLLSLFGNIAVVGGAVTAPICRFRAALICGLTVAVAAGSAPLVCAQAAEGSSMGTAPATTGDALKNAKLEGHIRHSNHPKRVARPKAHLHPLRSIDPKLGSGAAETHVKVPSAGLALTDFTLDGKHLRPTLSDFGMDGNTNQPLLPTGVANEQEDKEMVIAWEAWHKRVSEAIYDQWVELSDVPGEAIVRLHFGRDGSIDADIEHIRIPFAQLASSLISPGFSHHLEESFRHRVQEAVDRIKHSTVLEFPRGSRRTKVSWTARFSAHLEDGGYTWKTNDYERVPGH